ncbi:MAG: hypothetical protein QXX35_04700 [Desulfurococcaceae archaeon]
MASLTNLSEKKIIVIGDPGLCLIGGAAGVDYFIYRGDCSELNNAITSEEYSVYIILRDIYTKCKNTIDDLLKRDVLVILIDSPKIMKEIDPKKYYEELIAKYIGIRINL